MARVLPWPISRRVGKEDPKAHVYGKVDGKFQGPRPMLELGHFQACTNN